MVGAPVVGQDQSSSVRHPAGRRSVEEVEDPLSALKVYESALDAGGSLTAHDAGGSVRPLPLTSWLDAADPVDERLLDRAEGPVLDVGCGPGRHVGALADRGVIALGVDVSPVAVRLARQRGAQAVEGSIFDRVPGAGDWRTALILDGNIGIGGRPAALLKRVAGLLTPGGQILVELDEPGVGLADLRMRLQSESRVSDWFDWARVGFDVVDVPARAAGLRVAERWYDAGRWFATLTER